MYTNLLIAFIFCFSAQNVYGETLKLSLDAAIKLGIKKNENVQKANSQITEADAAVREAYSYIFPKVDLKAAQSRYYEAPIAAIGGTEDKAKEKLGNRLRSNT